MKVAVTRPIHQAQRLTDLLLAAGHQPVALPLLTITGPADGGEALRAALDRLGEYQWVVFTSVNGVEAFFDEVPEGEMPTVAVIGETTAEAVEGHGVVLDRLPWTEFTGEALVASFPEGTGKVLLPTSNLARPTVYEGLAVKGWTVDVVEAYRTVPVTPDAELVAQLFDCDLVTLASPSAASALAAAPDRSEIKAVTIGPTTTAAANDVGVTVVIEAASQSDAGLVAAVEAVATRT